MSHAPGRKARKRAFCLKQSYMDYVLHHYILGEPDVAEPIVKDLAVLGARSLDRYIEDVVSRQSGKTDRELCLEHGVPFTKNKAQWTTLVYRMLGVRGGRAEEFEKAGVSIRTIRVESGTNRVKESLSLDPFEFGNLMAEESWEESSLFGYLSRMKFFFVVFEKGEGDADSCLLGGAFWSMPESMLEGDAHMPFSLSWLGIATQPAIGETCRLKRKRMNVRLGWQSCLLGSAVFALVSKAITTASSRSLTCPPPVRSRRFGPISGSHREQRRASSRPVAIKRTLVMIL